MDRPSAYDPELALTICAKIANGENLAVLLKDLDHPSPFNWFKWLRENPDLQAEYAQAKQSQADLYAAQIVELADTPVECVRVEENEAPTGIYRKTITGDNTERTKLMIEARKWAAAKESPQKYGDRQAHQLLDENGKPAKAGGVVIIVDGAPAVPAHKSNRLEAE